MVSYLSHVTVDSHDAYAQSVWWTQVLGYAEDPDDPNEPGHEECMIFSPDGATRLLFIEVPDAKQVKNRLHLDLRPAEGSRDDELARLLEPGRHAGGRSATARRPRLGGAGRSGGQRVLHPAQCDEELQRLGSLSGRPDRRGLPGEHELAVGPEPEQGAQAEPDHVAGQVVGQR